MPWVLYYTNIIKINREFIVEITAIDLYRHSDQLHQSLNLSELNETRSSYEHLANSTVNTSENVKIEEEQSVQTDNSLDLEKTVKRSSLVKHSGRFLMTTTLTVGTHTV